VRLMIRETIKSVLIGLLIGALTYLLILLSMGTTVVTSSNIISVLLMSAGIGLISVIFEFDWNYLWELLIHFLGTFLLVVLMCSYNGWLPTLYTHMFTSFLLFLVIYVLVWVALYVMQWIDVQRINKRIKYRNQKK